MKKLFFPFGLFNERMIKEENSNLANRLHFVKPVLNLKCPESFNCFTQRNKIFDENKSLSNSKSKKKHQYNFSPEVSPNFHKSKNNLIKNKIKEIAQNNLHMCKRIIEATTSYDFKKMTKDYKKSQYYKKNVCRYPSINFFKPKKKKKMKYCLSFDSYNNAIFKYFDNPIFFPKINSSIITQISSDKSKKFRIKKRTLEEFNYKELKGLKFNKKNPHIININTSKKKLNENRIKYYEENKYSRNPKKELVGHPSNLDKTSKTIEIKNKRKIYINLKNPK